MNRLIFLLLFLFSCSAVLADVTVASLDSSSNEEVAVIEYWTSQYYDSIPEQNVIVLPNHQSFDQMIDRYQSRDFEYVESISRNLDFITKFLARLSRFIEDLIPKPSLDYNEGIFNFLVICGGLLVVFLLYKFFISGHQMFIKHAKETDEDEGELSFVEKNLMQVDINTYIENAVRDNDFSLAIRYQQLLNIQILQKKGLVNWHNSKTNLELIEPIANEELKVDFMSCAKIFDYVRFGNFLTNGEDYIKYKGKFEEFRRRWA